MVLEDFSALRTSGVSLQAAWRPEGQYALAGIGEALHLSSSGVSYRSNPPGTSSLAALTNDRLINDPRALKHQLYRLTTFRLFSSAQQRRLVVVDGI